MRRPIIAGNWKMNTCRESAATLIDGLKAEATEGRADVEVIVCPPCPYLSLAVDAAGGSSIQVGGQNAWHEASGAFTGETSCEMLKDVGCTWVILGHSERRQINKECDKLINQKTQKALSTGLGVILCVGELLEQREADQTEAVLEEQMTGGLADVSSEDMASVVIAYEPVWAIGTGKVATDEQAEAAHAFLRSWLEKRFNADVASATRILYGGSVKPDNAPGLLGQPNVDGALVGGASLKAESFVPIIQAGAASVA
ncbi:MAG: triose-phosphate isomerase [Planctomycetota bacterium]|jgi:triosephosphate isomerase